MPSRKEWLLRFIAGNPGDEPWVDRIRAMKGMFLFQKSGKAPPEVDYAFKPYDYGPFTPEIYRDVERLFDEGVIISSSGQEYRATGTGRDYLASVPFPSEPDSVLMEIRGQVTTMSFRELLRWVYSQHPESASRSVAKDIINDTRRRPNLR